MYLASEVIAYIVELGISRGTAISSLRFQQEDYEVPDSSGSNRQKKILRPAVVRV